MYTVFVYATYILGIALLFCSAGSALYYMGENRNGNWLTVAYRLATASLAALIIAGLLRTFQWHLVPFTTAIDSLCLFITLSLTVIILQLTVFSSHRALLCFYLPSLALIGGLSLFTAYPDLSVAPKEFSSGLLIAHVGLVFLAFALFFLAGLNGVAYAFQAHRLKHRKTTGLFQRLPSLDALDKNLFQLIRVGYPTFVVTLIVGGFWVWYEGDKLSPTWWISPKVGMSVPMLLFYAFTFHARAIGWLRGPKLAYLVCYGTAALIGFYLVLTLLGAQDHNFYGAAG